MLGGGPSIGRYIGTDIMGALIGNIVGAWLLGVSFWWFYLHNVSIRSTALSSLSNRGTYPALIHMTSLLNPLRSTRRNLTPTEAIRRKPLANTVETRMVEGRISPRLLRLLVSATPFEATSPPYNFQLYPFYLHLPIICTTICIRLFSGR